MKLYIYDHCPFCVRARMPFGLFGVTVTEEVLLNDDEATPISLIGVKQVPILQKPDGSYMGESLDIVHWVDEYAGSGRMRLQEEIRPEVQAWFDKVGEYVNKLVWPREVKLGLPEFATQSAVDYFVKKKESSIGIFDKHLNKTKQYLDELHKNLADLEALVRSPNALSGQLGMEDIIVFPILRNLTMVRGLVLPEKLMAYVLAMSEASGVPLYFDRAL
ncbi:MAG: GrxB family glutaredoxin [Neisseria sp.]|uniref:GrxB family glutaredoxin n=1 Tax=Neisseria sp. TaxID=192066 RepID=UPI0026DA9B0A|nr:GrxB family glutaredoxin [Neisseria sp.]MDO4641976.1 GrxB family glutaredoxin [Neisseria sp.]